MKTQMSCGCADTKCDILQDDLREFAHRIISLTADMFVGEIKWDKNVIGIETTRFWEGHNMRVNKERALAEEIKSIK
jgi:hypothetical protein